MRFSTWRIAWRNLRRNRRRTALAVTAVALGQLLVVFVNCMMAGSFDEMMRTITGPLVGHVQIQHADWREQQAVDLYLENLAAARAAIESLPRVESAAPRVYTAVLSAPGRRTGQPADAEAAMLIGVDVAVEAARGGILEGLTPERLPAGKGVVLGKVLARRLGVRPGQQVAVIGQDADEFPVSDLFDVTAVVRGKVDVVNRLGIILSLPEAQAFLALRDRAHEIIVRAADSRDAEQIAAAIERIPALAGARVLPWKQAVPQLAGLVEMKGWFDLIFVAILFVAAAAGIANTMMMSTFERTHEFGMLLALGARPRRIVGMIFLEAVILGVIGVAIGSAVGVAAVAITAKTGIDYGALGGIRNEEVAFAGMTFSYVVYPKLELRHVLLGVIAVTATSVLASAWPASIAARLEPAEAMRS